MIRCKWLCCSRLQPGQGWRVHGDSRGFVFARRLSFMGFGKVVSKATLDRSPRNSPLLKRLYVPSLKAAFSVALALTGGRRNW